MTAKEVPMNSLCVDDLHVGDRVSYVHPRHGRIKAHVEDIRRVDGVPMVTIGTDSERIEIRCVWAVPGVSLLDERKYFKL